MPSLCPFFYFMDTILWPVLNFMDCAIYYYIHFEHLKILLALFPLNVNLKLNHFP